MQHRVSRTLSLGVLLLLRALPAQGQVEHVPLAHPVYSTLDRLGVKGVLPLHSSTMLPLERGEVLRLVTEAAASPDLLTPVERATVQKYLIEFSADAGARPEEDFVVLGSHSSADEFLKGAVSDKEKHLFAYVDSAANLTVELLGAMEYRSIHGDTRGNTDATLKSIGGRFRGTIAGRLGYFLQSTNGALSGNRSFALSDPRLAANWKLSDAESPNFDFTEAYLRVSFGWAGVEFGREFVGLGVGYGDRLILSDNAPAFDAVSINARYKSFRFFFLHGAILPALSGFTGLAQPAHPDGSKYFAVHRFQFSLFGRANIGASEMIIYQRLTPEYAYLNPVNFFKSSEHQLRDRDNAFLVFDAEVFPANGCKLYGAWLIDDVNFSRLGSGSWGNEFAWQGGAYFTGAAGIRDVDALVEYTRIEPYVYSNRVAGNDYSHDGIGLGHRLPPNADELMLECRWQASPWLSGRLLGAYQRHGRNVTAGDTLLRNVGGSILQGHRAQDAEYVRFLDGNREDIARVRLRVDYEPIREVYLTGIAEFTSTHDVPAAAHRYDLALSLGMRVEY